MMVKKKGKKERRYSSARKRVEKRDAGFGRTTVNVDDGVSFFSLKDDKTRRVDVLPFSVSDENNPYADVGKLHYERTFWAHAGIGANQDRYVCPAKTASKRCPICEYVAKLQRDPDADPKLIKVLLPKERQLWNVVDTQDRDKGVQVWEISFHLFGKLLDTKIRKADEDEEYENFFHLGKDGLTLKLGVEMSSIDGGKPFGEVVTIDFKKRREQYDEDVLDNVQDLDDILAVLEYDKLKAIFLQTDDDGDDDDDDDDPPPKRTDKPKPKKKPKAEKEPDEDDDEDEPEPDDEDEPEPKPPKKKPKSKKNPAEEAGLSVGDEVEYEDDTCTITKISGDGSSLTLKDEAGEKIKAVAVDEVEAVPDEDEEDDPPPKPKGKKGGKGKPRKEPEEDEDKWDKDDDDWD